MSAFSRRSLLGLPLAAYAWAKTTIARAQGKAAPTDTEWRTYGGDLANTRYSPLDQINAGNFSRLEIAWRFKPDTFGSRPEYDLEVTPLVVKGVIYATVGTRRDVVAMDAATGELLWMSRLEEGERAQKAPRKLSGRGLAYWTDGREDRIYYVTIGYQLVALDARTGQRIAGFGEGGVVDLRLNDDQDIDLVEGDIGLHATPCVTKDVVIVGAAHSQGGWPRHHHNVVGYVRGFDVRTGNRLWIFHTIPKKGEFGYDTWLNGSAEQNGNTGMWAQVSADEELGLAYLPIEEPTGDPNGQYRPGPGLFGESIVAVDIKTGERRWHYQTVHHGIWDNDIPCAPILCDIPVGGRTVKALAQPTKQAFLFVLNRETGEPIWPIVEKKAVKGDVPGEWYSPTQPFPTKPPAYDRQGVSENDLIDFTPELKAEALRLAKNYTLGPLYTPATIWGDKGKWGTLMLPGALGGSNWQGGSYDPENHTVYIYSRTMPTLWSLRKNTDPNLSDFDYTFQLGPPAGAPPQDGFKAGQLTVQGLPLVKPPYGRISAIDLTKGEIVWQVAHGDTPDQVRDHPALKGVNIPRTGRDGLIGVLTTKTLVIAGEAGVATTPEGKRGAKLRAYDKATGADAGEVFLPAPQSGSPMTYMLGGRQYIVLAIGGGSYSAELIAFRLPKA